MRQNAIVLERKGRSQARPRRMVGVVVTNVLRSHHRLLDCYCWLLLLCLLVLTVPVSSLPVLSSSSSSLLIVVLCVSWPLVEARASSTSSSLPVPVPTTRGITVHSKFQWARRYCRHHLHHRRRRCAATATAATTATGSPAFIGSFQHPTSPHHKVASLKRPLQGTTHQPCSSYSSSSSWCCCRCRAIPIGMTGTNTGEGDYYTTTNPDHDDDDDDHLRDQNNIIHHNNHDDNTDKMFTLDTTSTTGTSLTTSTTTISTKIPLVQQQQSSLVTTSSSSSSSSVYGNDDTSNHGNNTSDDLTTDRLSLPSSARHSAILPSLRRVLGLPNLTSSSSLPPPPQVVGHRGALFEALENTRESFQRCIQLGCDAIELDVFWVPHAQKLVVFHGGDGNPAIPGELSDYTVNQKGRGILDLTTREIETIRFNPNFAEFPCPPDIITNGQIPSLEDVLLDMRGTGMEVKIEIKGPGTVEPVLELVERLDMTQFCSYSSFHHEWLQQLRRLRPDQRRYRTGALFESADTIQMSTESLIRQARLCGATEIHLQYDTCTVERIQQIHAAGLRTMAWFRGPRGMRSDFQNKYGSPAISTTTTTIVTDENRGKSIDSSGTEPEEYEDFYRAVWETGVEAMCVNRPDILLRMIRDHNPS